MRSVSLIDLIRSRDVVSAINCLKQCTCPLSVNVTGVALSGRFVLAIVGLKKIVGYRMCG